MRSKNTLLLMAFVTYVLWVFTIERAIPIFYSQEGNSSVVIKPISWETYLESRLLDDMNQARMKYGFAPLKLDSDLTAVARQRSGDMAEKDYFGHTSPQGITAFTILDEKGFNWGIAGENIAFNNYPNSQSALIAFEGLMKSPSHRENILEARYDSIGVSVVITTDQKKYFTIVFAGSDKDLSLNR